MHGPGVDEPLAIEQKGKLYFYHADGLGSIVTLTDTKGKVVQSYEYTSFGEVKQYGNKVKNSFTYTAREWDKEINLYFYRARYYDPQAGRFISKDPSGFKDGPNLYAYVQNNPVNFSDPLGLLRTSIDVYHQSCMKLPLGRQRCECHCAYASDYSGCVNKCMECFSSKTPLADEDMCYCTCKQTGRTDRECKTFCKGVCE